MLPAKWPVAEVMALADAMANPDKSIAQAADFVLRLYIAGNSSSSRQAQQNLKHLRILMKVDGAQVEVIDVLANPELAEKARILATPTLCCEHSGRQRRIVGDLGDPKRILAFLGVKMKGDAV